MEKKKRSKRNKRYGKRIDLELTHQLYSELRKRAETEGVGVRTIIRRGLMRELGKPVPRHRIPPEIRRAYREMMGHLGRIGNNLNQIARHANIKKELDREVLERLKTAEKALAVLAVRWSPNQILRELGGERDGQA